MTQVWHHVMDAVDMETFLACESEEEGKNLALAMMKELGFSDIDVVFCQFQGPGARVRVRAYLYRAGDTYPWLDPEQYAEAKKS